MPAVADDTIHKVHVGHYTLYMKSIVKDSRNVVFAPNVFVTDYFGGENIAFCDKNAVQQHLTSNTMSRSTPSIMCYAAAIPFTNLKLNHHGQRVCGNNTTCSKLLGIPNPISLHGNLNVNTHLGLSRDACRLHTCHDYYNCLYSDFSFEERLNQHDLGDGSAQGYEASSDTVDTLNFLTFAGPLENEQKQRLVVGTGHWANYCYDGCGSVRRGTYAGFDASCAPSCAGPTQSHNLAC